MWRFHKIYFGISLLLFFTEILIAVYAHDRFVRPYIGDMLVVILIYCFIKSFCAIPVWPLAIGVLIFAFLVEVSQYFKMVKLLGLQHNQLVKIILGTSFEWIDLAAYTAGIALVLVVEKLAKQKFNCQLQKF